VPPFSDAERAYESYLTGRDGWEAEARSYLEGDGDDADERAADAALLRDARALEQDAPPPPPPPAAARPPRPLPPGIHGHGEGDEPVLRWDARFGLGRHGVVPLHEPPCRRGHAYRQATHLKGLRARRAAARSGRRSGRRRRSR
jgi:hypothetical protein